MTMTIAGSGNITGLAVGGLPDATITPAELTQPMVQDFKVVSGATSSLNFTNVPSWTKKITVSISNASFSAAGVAKFRMGVGGVLTTSGYFCANYYFDLTVSPAVVSSGSVTDGIAYFSSTSATTNVIGGFTFVKVGDTDTWTATGNFARQGDSVCGVCQGRINLTGTLDSLSLVCTTSTLDAGVITVLYEG